VAIPDVARPPGWPPEIDEIDEIDVVVATLADGRPPARLGVTHWSARLLAAELKISFATVARIWRTWNLQPWRTETFKFSTDPELDAKIRDVLPSQIPASQVLRPLAEPSVSHRRAGATRLGQAAQLPDRSLR
jgi:hypothetical protein